jgi:5-methylcytosine-specific restriction endonuclease McrA
MTAIALQRPTLVLNKLWQPVHVRTAAEALKKVWTNSARVVDPQDYAQYTWEDWADLRPAEGDLYINLIGTKIRIPEVITLANFDRTPRGKLSFNRKNLFIRDGWTCQYCNAHLKRSEITMDHVIPRVQGGESSFENCVAACARCNRRKAGRTPKQARMKLLTVPKTPKWGPLFHCTVVLDSWEKFVSEMYWNVPLQK